jgi:pyruvate kinase
MKPVSESSSTKHRSIEKIVNDLLALRAEVVAEPRKFTGLLEQVHANYRDSACNLLHYLALRRRDLRPLQDELAALGLSSLGRAESHVLAAIDAVVKVLNRLLHRSWQPPDEEIAAVDFASGQRILNEHTGILLGEPPEGRQVRIMVTMPSEAADDYTLIHRLLQQGMDCMRINCAHDDAHAWSRMIGHLRRAEQALEKSCKVAMDLAGPKLRTGPLLPGPAVARIRPFRDSYGNVIAPARIWLTPESTPHSPPSPASASLLVDAEWMGHLREGKEVRFTDARDARRQFKVVAVGDQGCWAEAVETAYIDPGTVLRIRARKEDGHDLEAIVGDLPHLENAIGLKPDDSLIVTRDMSPGRPASYDSAGRLLSPATIGCTMPEIFDDVVAGESIWFDDGRIGGLVERVEEMKVRVRVTHARIQGDKLRGDKGINLPESNLRIPAMTEKDREDLSFVARHADVVELSFANSSQDVQQLQTLLNQMGGNSPAVVLKIETRRGFENLPDMLLTAMRSPCIGVMIARGDLAVECGFERMAEVQEEILWLCEAAHVPVIWATQVLESLAKDGIPSRAEITDAAMGNRAECVMLNKGPHIDRAVKVLDDILRRMQAHHTKKRSMLRQLNFGRLPSADPA